VSVVYGGGKTLETGVSQVAVKGPSVVPSTTGNLAVVSGTVLITGIYAVVTTVFTATGTTLSVGTTGTSTSGGTATAAGVTLVPVTTVLTSLAVGALILGLPTPSAPVPASAGNITWLASATNTGQLKVYIMYVPLDAGAGVS
jgi:hypothetical protein